MVRVMVIDASICPRCGAPLPPFAASPISCCTFCGCTVRISERTTTIEKESASPLTSAAELRRRTRQFDEAVKQAFAAGMAPLDAVRAGAVAHLGPFGQCDAVARVAVAIAYDFDKENATQVQTDAIALSRIVEAYLNALPEIHAEGEAIMNLPFLTANARGPQHLQRMLRPADLAALAARDLSQPASAARPEAPTTTEDAPRPKRKGWWPF
jgi:hypothetical protein